MDYGGGKKKMNSVLEFFGDFQTEFWGILLQCFFRTDLGLIFFFFLTFFKNRSKVDLELGF